MAYNILEILFLLCYVNSFALALRQDEYARDKSDWIVFIKHAHKKTCAGVKLSNAWILTMGYCIEQGALKKYKAAAQTRPKTLSIREERRSPDGGYFVLLRTEVSSTPETKTRYPGLATSTLFDNLEQFHTYRYTHKEVFEAISIEFVNKQRCLRTDVAGKFGKGQYTCYKFKPGDSDICLPGLPMFGSVRKKVVLQGLSNTAADACDTLFQATAAVAPVRGWLLQQLKDCGYPKVKNGKATLDEPFFTTFGATASVSCNKGYASERNTLTCKDSGEWEKTKCVLRDCGPAPIFKNGQVVLDVPAISTVGASASVTCGERFITEIKSIACKANGKWETPKCKLIDCGSLPSVNNGEVNLDSKETVIYSTATVSCDLGFSAISSLIICQNSGMWEVPACTALKDCGSVSEIKNGYVVLLDSSETFVGSIAYVKCDVGYKPSRPEAVCKESGKWEDQACIIKDCGSPPSFPGGSVTLDSTTTTFSSTATVICNGGFFANQLSIICDEKGRWEVPRCIIKDCGPPPTLRNGSAVLDSTTTEFNSTASVTCDIGHETNQTSISCLESGLWEVPTCTIKDCGFLPSITDGSVDLDLTTTVYGSTATLSCSSGFYTNQTSIVCQKSGRWEVSTCTIKDCGSLLSLSNGDISLDTTTSTVGSTATVNCDEGYKAIPFQITCLGTGRWEIPTCKVIDCGPPPTPRNGSTVLDSTTTTFDSTASVTCEIGHKTNQTLISCLESGLWEVPICTIKDCGFLPSVSDGSVDLDSTTTVYGSTATLSCSSGFYSNDTSIVCQESGRWQVPTCTLKDCGSLLSLSNGDISLDTATTTVGSTATVNCDKGYEASTSEITCQRTGLWEVPTCRLIDCGQLPLLENGLLTLSAATTYGSSASVTCNNGYSGNKETITCKSTGSWATAKCTIKDCGSLPSLSDGTLSLDSSTTTYGSTASVTCSTGYYANENTITCIATGIWDTPTCTIKDCGSLASLADGSLTLDSSTTTYGSTASATCDAGYDASKSSITCLETGAWQTTKCKIRDCGSKPSVKNGSTELDSSSTTVGSTVTVTCKSGYSTTKTSLVCKTNGAWAATKCSKN